MFQPNSQLAAHPIVSTIQDSSGMIHADQADQKKTSVPVSNNVQNGGVSQGEFINFGTKRLQDELEMLGRKSKQHEENLNFLTNQNYIVEKSILDLPVVPRKDPGSAGSLNEDDMASEQNQEKAIIEKILQREKFAAAVLYQLNTRHSNMAAGLPWTNDVLGVVATLGRIEDDNLSRLLSEYLGVSNMMAIVCKTYESVRALETYDSENNIIRTSGLHGLGASMGRPLDGRFLVICLENLRPYIGKFVANDPQKRLDLEKPRLPNGKCPPGFLGYAVNMITIESTNLLYLTSRGSGLRETLFYHLFSRLQVYKTRSEMLAALSCMSDGAISLDGGIIKSTGVFSLGDRQEIDVIFPKSCGMAGWPVEYYEREIKMRELQWKKDMISEDIRRERSLLEHSQTAFALKKQEYLQFLTQSSLYMSQQHGQAAQENLTPLPR
ncbi:unnamed protein product [Rhodiola kirilowii]